MNLKIKTLTKLFNKNSDIYIYGEIFRLDEVVEDILFLRNYKWKGGAYMIVPARK
jgi:hypothetical protein